MVYYSILEVTPTDNSWVQDYLKHSIRLTGKYGGTYIARTAEHEQLEGLEEENVALRIIIKWPNKQSALDFMNDDEYKTQLKARTKGSISKHYLVKGNDDFA